MSQSLTLKPCYKHSLCCFICLMRNNNLMISGYQNTYFPLLSMTFFKDWGCDTSLKSYLSFSLTLYSNLCTKKWLTGKRNKEPGNDGVKSIMHVSPVHTTVILGSRSSPTVCRYGDFDTLGEHSESQYSKGKKKTGAIVNLHV